MDKMNSLDNILLGIKLSEDEPFAYNTLILVFGYLDIEDLLSCSQVCKIWCWIVRDQGLWNNLIVRSCTKHIEDVAQKYGTKITNLDLLNPKLLPLEYLKYISQKMVNLRRIRLYGCHKDQLKLLAENHKNLERIYAEINWGNPSMELDFIENLHSLTHLELITHIEVTEVQKLKTLKKLKHLVFHAPCNESCWKYVAEVESLESMSLDADIATSWDTGLFDACVNIKRLKHLKKLQINDLPYFHEYGILEKIKDLSNIKELILLNISISRAGTSSFGKLLGQCHNIEKLTISIFRVVFYSSVLDVALENSEIINGATALKGSLKHFCWIMDSSGLSSVRDFYHMDNATALKISRSKQQTKTGSKSPFIEGLAPITLTKLLSTLQKRLPNTNVSLLDSQNQSDSIVKKYCYMCKEKVITAQDRMRSYT